MTLLAALKRLGLLGRFTSNRPSIVRRFLEHVASGEEVITPLEEAVNRGQQQFHCHAVKIGFHV